MNAMTQIIKGYKAHFADGKPWRIHEIERLFDIEFNKRVVRHGAKKTTGIWPNEDYDELKSRFIKGVKEAYNPTIKGI